MKIPSLIAGTFSRLNAKFFFLLALPLLLGAAAGPTLAPVATPFAFHNTGSLNTARYVHTATLLPNGKVLAAGGYDGSTVVNSAELYDPASGTWTATGRLNAAREVHTATLLPNGKVLVAGGQNNGAYLTSAELYDPVSGTWTATGSLNTARQSHTATLLPNGKVLVVGGNNERGVLASAELYDPVSGTWTTTGGLNTARYWHTATLLSNGNVLVAGGGIANSSRYDSAELYDPVSGTWTATGSLNTARYLHTATLLPNGKVLVAGGESNGYVRLTSAELYDPASGTWTATGSLNTERYVHTSTLLPNGKVLVSGGIGGYASAELYDPALGTWTATGSLSTARFNYTSTLLPNGEVLVAGGYSDSIGFLTSTELYDSASGAWSVTGALATARRDHTATLLPNGKVLVTGGYNGVYLSSAELYDPAAGTWSATGALATGRVGHTATLLPNGKVLVAGGANGVYLSSAELYDPAAGTWSATGALATAHYLHTATLLPNGKVLVAGGYPGLSSAELYDPAAGTWSATGALATGRYYHTATLLPNGKVLVAGGVNDFSGKLSSAELYDPAAGTWSATGDLVTAHAYHTATLLPDGKVLVAGGFDNSGPVSSAELYDPAAGTWSGTGALATARRHHTATLLPNGKALVVGGYNNVTGVVFSSAELYDVGLGFVRPDWQPQIATATSPLITGSSLVLTGSLFQGISEASGGGNFQGSSTNYPVVQLRSIDNSQVVFLPVDPMAGWSDTTFTSTPVNNFPPGPALVTVFTNGIPSDSKYLVVATSTPTSTPPTITVSDASGTSVPCDGVKTVSNNGQCGTVTVPLNITASGNCPGTITVTSTRSDGKLVTDPYPVGLTTVSSTAMDSCGKTSTCTVTVEVTNNKTIASNFNGTAIPAGSTIWFNSVLKPSGLDKTNGPVTVKFFNQKITSSKFSLSVPDTTVIFDSTVTCASAAFVNGQWMITAPKSGLSGNTFLSGLSYQVPAAGLPGGIKPVSWSGTFITDTAGVSLNWQWAAAVYNSSFNANNAVLGVKATDDNHHDCTYLNSDHAGTPEQYKAGLIGGAMGGGGSNYTGGLSGTQSIAPCDTF